MFPWLWVWAPQLRFPFSGDVTQDIEPSVSAFFKNIRPEAGNARIEERAFAVASYGKQLGLLTDLLIQVAQRTLPDKGSGDTTLQELERIRNEIEKIKQAEYEAETLDLQARVEAIAVRGGARAAHLAKRLKPLLEGR